MQEECSLFKRIRKEKVVKNLVKIIVVLYGYIASLLFYCKKLSFTNYYKRKHDTPDAL